MKILVITQYFYPENFRVNTLCKELVQRGHEVTVLTGYPQYPYGKIYEGYGFCKPYEDEWHGVKINRIKMLPRGKTPIGLLMNCISFVVEGNKWVKRCTEKYDAMYVFEVSPVTVGLLAVKYKEKFGTPIYFNVQDLWPENVEVIMGIHNKVVIHTINKIVDKIYNASDKILCSSRGFVGNIKSRGIEDEKVVFWPQFCEAPDIEEMKRPEVLDKEKFNIVFTGNIGKAQGLDLLVHAISEINDDSIRCYLVGDGRAIEELKKLVIELKLEQRIVFIGRVTEHEANEYICYADVAYMSLKDNKIFDMTIPAKLQTYLACGVPIIAAVGGECAEIIRMSNCGICVEKNIQDLTQEIRKLQNAKKSDLKQMRENAKKCFEDNFTKHKLVGQLEKMMKDEVE